MSTFPWDNCIINATELQDLFRNDKLLIITRSYWEGETFGLLSFLRDFEKCVFVSCAPVFLSSFVYQFIDIIPKIFLFAHLITLSSHLCSSPFLVFALSDLLSPQK